MNFQVILSNFKEYLELKSNVYEPNEANIDYQNISIFDYKDEFKDFLKTTYNYDLTKTAGMIEELKELQIVDGKLVNPDEISEEDKNKLNYIPVDQDEMTEKLSNIQTTETETVEASEGASNVQNVEAQGEEDLVPEDSLEKYGNNKGVNIESAEFVTAVLNEFLKDEDFRKAIDKNGDSKIDESDIEAFLDVIKCYDDMPNNISLDDLLMAADDITEGTFRYLTDDEIVETIAETGPTKEADAIGLSPGESGRNVTAGSIGTPQKLPIQKEDGSYIPENMSNDELKSAENELTGKIQNNKTELQEAIEDKEGQKLKEAMNESLDTYNDAIGEVDSSLSEKISEIKEKISNQENLIVQKENTISEQNELINTNNGTISECDTKISDLENAQSQVQSAQNKADESDTTDYNSQLVEIQNQIKQINEQKQEAQSQLKEAQNNLNQATEEKALLEEELSKQKEELNNYEQEAKALEEKHPELTAKREQYEKAKETYEQHANEQPNIIQTARDNLSQNQQALNNIKQEQVKRQSKQDTSKYNPNSSIVDYARTFNGMSETQVESKLGGVNLPNGLWCAAYVNNMLKGSVGEENLPQWYNQCNPNSCSDVYGAANRNNATYTDANSAQSGDLIFFNTSRGNCKHIGIVTKVENGKVYTIEGNSSNKVQERQYDINGNRIFGFARLK